MPRPVAALVRLQLLTGARPSELLNLRPCDLDVSGPVWVAELKRHKLTYRGKTRTLCFGPRAQDVVRPFLDRPFRIGMFSPQDAIEDFLARKTAARVTPLSCGNRPGSNVKRHPRKAPGECYTADTYRHAIEAACDKAGIPRWTDTRRTREKRNPSG